MERLVALAKDVREVQAREAWYHAMADFQRLCPAIKKTSSAKITTRGGGSYSYKFAPLDEITSVISPIMGPLGLSFSWRSKIEPDRVVVSCRVSHTLGHHEESGDIPMPIEKGDGAGANAMQRVGIALTYAKRYSLLGIIGKAPEDDDDAAATRERTEERGGGGNGDPQQDDGRTITEAQEKRFWAIAREHKWGDDAIRTLLTELGVDKATAIPMAKYDGAIDRLKKGPGPK